MNDQSDPRRPDQQAGDDATPQASYDWSSTQPIPAADPPTENTRAHPSFMPPPPVTQHARSPRSGGLTAAVLAGALVLGGAAGIGGAAGYVALHDSGSASSSDTGSGGSNGVNVTSSAPVSSGDVEKVAASVLPSVVKVNVTGSQEAGSGSGFVLTKDGDIVTNNHVVAVAGQGGSITVSFNDGSTKKATVVGTDPVTDIAVIRVEGAQDLKPAPVGASGDLKVGQDVVAVGSPFGLNATVTSGIVSALNRPVSVSTAQDQQSQQDPFGFGEQQSQQQSLSTTYPAIQTDAAINPGNSGGPLVDLAGRVVGINSSIRTGSDSTSGSSGGSVGLGFAIPMDEVRPIVNQILAKQTPTHARLGITVSDQSGSSLEQGAVVRSLEGGGSAADAGLKTGDVITKVGSDTIDGSESLVATVRGHRPGEKVTLTYLRGGQTRTTTATLGSDAGTTSS